MFLLGSKYSVSERVLLTSEKCGSSFRSWKVSAGGSRPVVIMEPVFISCGLAESALLRTYMGEAPNLVSLYFVTLWCYRVGPRVLDPPLSEKHVRSV